MKLTWTFHPLVVIRVDAHTFILFVVEGKFAALERFEFVMRLKVRPPPHSAVDDVRQPLPVRHLQTTVQ